MAEDLYNMATLNKHKKGAVKDNGTRYLTAGTDQLVQVVPDPG